MVHLNTLSSFFSDFREVDFFFTKCQTFEFFIMPPEALGEKNSFTDNLLLGYKFGEKLKPCYQHLKTFIQATRVLDAQYSVRNTGAPALSTVSSRGVENIKFKSQNSRTLICFV